MSDEGLPIPITTPGSDQATQELLTVLALMTQLGEQNEKNAGSNEKATLSLANATLAYHAVAEAVGKVKEAIETVIALADEQQRLTDASEHLGLNFDRASEAAGRFTDETDTMRSAQRFAASDIHLTQTELDALARVAGAKSRELGVSTSEAMRMLTESLITGREQGLRRFGEELVSVAGHSHSVDERLQALTRTAGNIPQAADTAADSLERLKDQFGDMARDAASAFVDSTEHAMRFGREVNTANDNMQSLKTVVVSFAREAANTMVEAGRGVQLLGAILEYNVARIRHPLDLMNADVRRTEQGVVEAWRRLRATVAGDFSEDEDATGLGGSGGAQVANFRFGGDDSANTPNDPGRYRRDNRSREAAARRAEREEERRQHEEDLRQSRVIAESFAAARREGDARRAQGIGDPRDSGFMSRALTANDNVSALDDEQKRRDREAQGDADFARSDEGRGIAQQRERNAARERRQQDQRLDALRSFTERWEDLHSRQANATQMAADTASKAFDLMGQGLAKHIELLAQGKESVGEAARAFTSELLTNLGHEAIAKGAMEFAEGLASLATPVTAPLAAGHFAASAAFISAGALMSGLGAAAAPSAPSAGGGRGSAPAGRASLPSSTSSATASEPVTHVYNYYAPTYGGREGSRAETGTMVQRDLRAADARLQREAA